MSHPLDMPLHDLSEAIRRRRISPVTLCEAAQERIGQRDPALHAFCEVAPGQAMAAALRAERELAGGHWRGPLHGVPLGLKDNIAMAGCGNGNGIPALRRERAQSDATVTARLKEGGAVILGKLAMTEGASFRHHPDVPCPVNPLNPQLWSGASSSGSGVAVAAGMVVAALGSDTAGSIRVPAACNNLSGLKPGLERIGTRGLAACAAGFDVVGPMARSVADLAAVLAVIDGAEHRAPAFDPASVLNARGDLSGLRILVDTRFNTLDPDPDTHDALAAATDRLAACGARIVAGHFPDPEAALHGLGLLIARANARSHAARRAAFPGMFSADFARGIDFGTGLSEAKLATARDHCAAFRDALLACFTEADMILTPVLPHGTPDLAQLGALLAGPPDRLLRYSAPISIAGLPALTLPCGRGANGRPVSMQLVGRPMDETRLLRAGHVFQTVTGWHRDLPRVAPHPVETAPPG
ncbi:amidase [Acidimangrovimonas sediminis]|uniref:amidase n=1 Tax=Acidimangrovimonas sediminis TaxID=2056283 RepID=UPI000C80C754|nr:amidase [Acidimangrovimonas sediminis]